MADTSQVKEITAKLEQGVKDLFSSDRYADYLKTMSRFHRYSTRNTLLIHIQKPDATLVAGFRSWQTKFGRSVRKGEKSIKILAPVPFVTTEEKEKLDPTTRQPIIGDDGMPVVEYTERHLARFKVTSVFDVSQTAGKPLPSLAQNLTGDVEQYNVFMDTLLEISPLPIVFEDFPENQDGVCRFGQEIAIRTNMSQSQTVCAVIHEIVHAKIHDKSLIVEAGGDEPPKDRRREEVEAESISYSVAAYFGIETGENSFGYIAEWSRTQELKELNASLDTIRKTATELITDIEGKFKEILKDHDVNIAIGETHEIEPTQEHSKTSLEIKLYEKFAELFPDVANRKNSYQRLDAGDAFMPLSLEWINSTQISVMQTYTLNGDLYYDPMIVFEIGYTGEGDNERMTLNAVEYQQSIPPLYQVEDADGRWISIDGNGNEKAIFGLQESINEFAAQWFENISNQGYMPVKANIEIDSDTVQVTFDADENSIQPLPDCDPTKPECILPDPSINDSEMNAYGYSGDGMYPLTQSRATELYDANHTIYLLYQDNTEAMIFDRNEIANHDGIFGIEYAQWETSHEYSPMKVETNQNIDNNHFIALNNLHKIEESTTLKLDDFISDKPESSYITYSQVGNRSESNYLATLKAKQTLAERIAEKRIKANLQWKAGLQDFSECGTKTQQYASSERMNNRKQGLRE